MKLKITLLALALSAFGYVGYQTARADTPTIVVDAGVSDAGSGSAEATPTPRPSVDSDPLTFIEASYNAFKAGNWTHVVALGLILLVWIARQKWALGKIEFFRTDRGGVVMVFAMSLFGGVAHALLATKGLPSFAALKTVALAAFMAIGGYVGLKRMLYPSDKKPAEATPA